MSEVTGIGPTDPKNLGDDSLKALQGETSLIDILKQQLTTQTAILEVLRSTSSQSISSSSISTDPMLNVITANTNALLALTDRISTATLDVNVKGNNSFFEQLIKASSGAKPGSGLETFAEAYSRTVIKMANLDRYTDQINHVTQALLGTFGTFKEFGKGLMFFAGGLALLGFTLMTFMEAITLSDLMTFGAIMVMLRLAAEVVGKGSWDLAKVSVGIAVLGLAVWGFTEVVTPALAGKFVLSIGLVSLGLGILSLVSNRVGTGAMGMAKGAGAIAAIAGSLWIMNQVLSDFDEIDLIRVTEVGIATMGFAFVYNMMGKMSGSIIKGALAAGFIGGSLWLLAKGIDDISQIQISMSRGLEVIAIITGAVAVVALMGNPITLPFIIAGAIAAGSMGVALFLLAAGLNAVSTVDITQAQAQTFGISLERIVDAISYLGNPFTAASVILALPASLALAGSTLALAGAIWAISKMKILKPTQYDNFSYAIERIVKTYTDLGFWGLGKATIAAGIVGLISGATLLSAGAINAFTKIAASPEAVNTAVLSLDGFISGVSATFDKNRKKFGAIREGVTSFFGLTSMVKEIADSVGAIANLEFIEKSVINGKIVTTGIRKMTPDDFKDVGKSIGSIISSLTEPLSLIGSQKESYSIGGFKITNPFSNKVKKGIESMTSIGAIFTPLSSIINTFSSRNINSTFIESFNKNIASMLGGIGHAFSTTNVSIDDDVVKSLLGASTAINTMLDKTMHKKFEKGMTGFGTFSKNLAVVKTSLNSIDLAKLTKFNSMLVNLNELGKSNAIEELIKLFTEFIEKLVKLEELKQQPQQTNIPTLATSVPVTQSITQQKQQQKQPDLQNLLIESNEDMINAITMMHEFLTSGNLHVKVKQSTFN